MQAKEKLFNSYIECLNIITGYDDIGNELNFLSESDELFCKVTSVTLTSLLIKGAIELRNVYVPDMFITKCMSKVVLPDVNHASSIAHALMCSNEGIETCRRVCMRDEHVTLEGEIDKLISNQSFKELCDYVLNEWRV